MDTNMKHLFKFKLGEYISRKDDPSNFVSVQTRYFDVDNNELIYILSDGLEFQNYVDARYVLHFE